MRKYLVFLCVPIIIVIVGLFFMSQMYPLFLNVGFFGQDPAYQYLFAGVDILQGHAPVHTDHPGTPLQSLIALMILIAWGALTVLGRTEAQIFESVLSMPETYLASISIVVLVLGAVAAYFIGQRVYQFTNSVVAAISCQLGPLLFALVSPYMVYPTPEAVLQCISIGLLAVLAPALLTNGIANRGATNKTAICAGVLCGLGVAVKITFLPMLGLLISLRSFRLIATAVSAMVLAWLVGVLPIFSRLPVMFAWFYQVLTHTQLHGQGDQAVFAWQQFIQNIKYLQGMFPLFYAVMIVLALCLGCGCVLMASTAFRMRGDRHSSQRGVTEYQLRTADLMPAISMVLAGGAQTIMVAKHPGPTYMIGVLPIMLVGAVWLIYAQRIWVPPKPLRQIISIAWVTLLFFTVVTSSIAGFRTIQAIHGEGYQSYKAIKNQIDHFQSPILIGTFNCNLPECALWFGLLLVPEMDLKMDRITPDFYHFDIFSRKLHLPGVGELSAADTAKTVNQLVQSGRPVLLISPPYEHLAQFTLQKLLETPIQNLYRVTGFEQPNQ